MIQETFKFHICFTSKYFYDAIISLIVFMLHQYFTIPKALLMSSWYSVFLICPSACLRTKQGIFWVAVKSEWHDGGVWFLSTSRTSGAACSPQYPFSPWPLPPGFSEMVQRSFLACRQDWCLWDYLWRVERKTGHNQKFNRSLKVKIMCP